MAHDDEIAKIPILPYQLKDQVRARAQVYIRDNYHGFTIHCCRKSSDEQSTRVFFFMGRFVFYCLPESLFLSFLNDHELINHNCRLML